MLNKAVVIIPVYKSELTKLEIDGLLLFEYLVKYEQIGILDSFNTITFLKYKNACTTVIVSKLAGIILFFLNI